MERAGPLPSCNRRPGRVVASAPVRRTFGTLVCCVAAAGLANGCGGGERQDDDEPSGTFDVQVLASSFPREQSISQPATLRIVVRNDGRKTIPNLAVSLDGLAVRNPQPGLADPEQPLWVIEDQPSAGQTAYVFTWALGPLQVGATQTFTWRLSPAVTGTHTVKWTVAAGLTGNARARTTGGRRPAGSFTVRVSDVPAPATVDPQSGDVVRGTT